jgi:alpha-D-xyloside xylohydrolase
LHRPRARFAATTAALALALVSLAGASPKPAHAAGSVPAHAESWNVVGAPFALNVLGHGTVLVTDALGPAGPGTRFSYQLSDGSRHTLTTVDSTKNVKNGVQYHVATDEPGRAAVVTVTRIAHGVHVSWRLAPADGVSTVYTAMRGTAPNEHYVGAGINHAGVDLTGQLVQLKVAYSCGRSIVTPFFASSAGYGVYFETAAVGQMEFQGTHDGMACDDSNSGHALCDAVSAPDRVQACFKQSSLDYDVFVGPPAKVVAAFRSRAGRMPVPAKSSFGVIKWRDQVKSSAQVLDDVAQFRRLKIPLGTVLLDNPWQTDGCWGALTFDKSRFPNPAALIRRIHDDGARFMVWVSPWVTPSAACNPLTAFPPKTTLPTPQGWNAIDFTSSAASRTFEQKIANLVHLGVDGFKGDRGDETDLEGMTFASGDPRVIHDLYPELFARAVIAGARAAGERAPETMFRSGWTGTPDFGAGVWAGDQYPAFSGLKDAIHSLLSLGASGFALAGSDVGGYGTGTSRQVLTPAVFERWTQLGALSPIMEIGGADRAATFWKLGPQAISVARSSILLHYDLFPYLYGLAQESSRTGSPILQPLGLVYPSDAQAWKHDLELLVGRDLLAAPVTSTARKSSVYLPAGQWIDLFTGRLVKGHRTIERMSSTRTFPLYLRTGTAIPFNLREARLWPRRWPLSSLTLSGRGGWLSAQSKVTLTNAPRETEVLFPRTTRPTSVTVDGRPVPGFSSAAALRSAPTGWVWNTKPFPGVLVKIHPAHGRARVAVS